MDTAGCVGESLRRGLGVLKSSLGWNSMLGGFEELQPSRCSAVYWVNLHPSADGGSARESLCAFLRTPVGDSRQRSLGWETSRCFSSLRH